jgi:hypothetical protein
MSLATKLVKRESENLKIHDSTKLETFQECPRKYFFSFILHLRPRYANLHIQFGQDVHNGAEVLDDLGWSKEGIEPAMDSFKEGYGDVYSPSVWEEKAPKNPSGANAIYKALVKAHDPSEITIMKEIALPVPVSDSDVVWCKMDRIYVKNGVLYSLDYKTSGKLYSDLNKRALSRNQFKAYTAALNYHFSKKGAIGDLQALFAIPYKNAPKTLTQNPFYYSHAKADDGNAHALLVKIPCKYDDWDLVDWKDRISVVIQDLQLETDRLSCSKDTEDLKAFPKKPGACFSYNTICPFFNICHTDALVKRNPLYLAQNDNPPLGFRREVWNPRESGNYVLKDGKAVRIEKEKPKKPEKKPGSLMASLVGDR